MEADTGVKFSTDPDPAAVAIVNADDPEAAAAAAPADTSAAAQVAAQLGDALDPSTYSETKVRVKVDGEETELTLADVVKSYQKDQAASRRLTEATTQASIIIAEANKRAEELRQAAEATPQSTARTEAAAPNAKAEEAKAALKAKYKELSEAQFTGDTDRAADIQMEIDDMRGASQGTAPVIDTNQMVAELTPRIRQQVTLDSAYDDFNRDYSEITGNPLLNGMAVAKFKDLCAEGKDIRTAFKESGDFVREEVKKLAGSYGMTDGSSNSPAAPNEKLTRKEAASAQTVITAAGVKTAITEAKPQTHAEVIAEMRRARGQGGITP